MSARAWKPLGGVPTDERVEARLQLHHAGQIPAAVGNTIAAAEPDWAHLSFDWNESLGALVGRPGADVPTRLALAVADVELLSLDDADSVTDRFPLAGRTFGEGLAWAAERFGAELTPPDHELPPHPVADGAAFTLARGAASTELAHWFSDADRVLASIEAPTRTWPHHFDSAALELLDPEKGVENSRSINVGMSPGDGSYADPYWYVVPWPLPEPAGELADLDGDGLWHRAGWTGAVLPAARLVAGPHQEQQVDAFVRSARAAARDLLG